MDKQAYEDRKIELEEAIDQAQEALWVAETRRNELPPLMHYEDALHQAQQEYDKFMGREVE